MKYYWIDPSCDGINKTDFDVYVREARALALRASQRLASPTDTDFARVFNLIYKTPKAATAKYPAPENWYNINGLYNLHPNVRAKKTVFKHVMDILTDFATDWEKTDVREKAHVRIYNDCGLRLKYYKDAKLSYDPVNDISMVTDSEILPKNLYTACTLKNLPPLLAGNTTTPALRMQVNKVSAFMITRLIAHEFMHTHPYGLTDGSAAGTGRYTAGWRHIMSETKDDVWPNAEAIALLIFAAGAADTRPQGKTKGGYTVARSWDSIPGSSDPDKTNLKWDSTYPFNSAAGGEFVFYDDLTD
ncbi:hypothetical protein QBC37DRAFT_292265 [Rhypophila decipiens]|uniref:Uncharacterized protein n=1 Tax=Rhypophila decipiens TaxID=261697 RepID=A0AAN7B2P1_9PEZI|nr:hypothetical protein QBC37DRAFT_292265 [Rhypophila decipiens]